MLLFKYLTSKITGSGRFGIIINLIEGIIR